MNSLPRLLLRWLAAMALTLGAALLGIRHGVGIPNAPVWHIVLFAFQLICIIASPLLGLRWGRKLERLRFLKKYDPAAARREAEAHLRSRIRPEWISRCTAIYLAVLTAAALGSSFFSGAGSTGIGTTQLLSMYVLYGMTGRFPWKKTQGLPRYALLLEILRDDWETPDVWTTLALVLPRKRLEYDAEVNLLLPQDNENHPGSCRNN